jgi:hypothetical protein
MEATFEILLTVISVSKYLSAPSLFMLSSRVQLREKLNLKKDQKLYNDYDECSKHYINK